MAYTQGVHVKAEPVPRIYKLVHSYIAAPLALRYTVPRRGSAPSSGGHQLLHSDRRWPSAVPFRSQFRV